VGGGACKQDHKGMSFQCQRPVFSCQGLELEKLVSRDKAQCRILNKVSAKISVATSNCTHLTAAEYSLKAEDSRQMHLTLKHLPLFHSFNISEAISARKI